MNKDAFFQYKENRALSGYKSAWLVKMPSDTKYSLVGLTESVPYVFGDKGTFDFNILQSPVIGQVEDKMSLEAQDIEVLHHRDNAYRYENLKGQTLDFMSINSEFVGYKFVGTLDYRPNNAEADVNRATVTITPISASVKPILNARSEIMETLCLANVVPETIKVGETIDLSVVQSTSATVTAKLIPDGEYDKSKETVATGATIDGTTVSFTTSGLYVLTVSASGYASWTTTVYVESAN